MFDAGDTVYVCEYNDSAKHYEVRELEYYCPSQYYQNSSWVNILNPRPYLDEEWLEHDRDLFPSRAAAIGRRIDELEEEIRNLLRLRRQLQQLNEMEGGQYEGG